MLKRIVQTVYLLIVSPQRGWRRIVARQDTHQAFMNDFLFPILGMIALTTFVGSMWGGTTGTIASALKKVIVVITTLLSGFYLASYALDKVYQQHEQLKETELIQKFVGYSSSVIYLLFFIMPLLPGFEIIWLFILYTFYLVYSGTTIFLNISEKQKTTFTMISFLLITFTPVLLNFMLSFVVM